MRYPSGVVSKPGRVYRAGLCRWRGSDGVCVSAAVLTRALPRQMQAGQHMVANRHDLPVQPKGENFPVNFLLFTESPISLSRRLHLRWQIAGKPMGGNPISKLRPSDRDPEPSRRQPAG